MFSFIRRIATPLRPLGSKVTQGSEANTLRGGESVRLARITALRVELDVQGERSTQRTRTIESKATYTATAAAAVIAASISIMGPELPDFLAVVPLVLAIATIYQSTRALVPLSIDAVGARKLVNKYVDLDISGEELSDHLLEIRASEIEARDSLNEERSQSMARGFKLLTLSFGTLLASAALSGLWFGDIGDGGVREEPPAATSPAATSSGSATQAP